MMGMAGKKMMMLGGAERNSDFGKE